MNIKISHTVRIGVADFPLASSFHVTQYGPDLHQVAHAHYENYQSLTRNCGAITLGFTTCQKLFVSFSNFPT